VLKISKNVPILDENPFSRTEVYLVYPKAEKAGAKMSNFGQARKATERKERPSETEDKKEKINTWT